MLTCPPVVGLRDGTWTCISRLLNSYNRCEFISSPPPTPVFVFGIVLQFLLRFIFIPLIQQFSSLRKFWMFWFCWIFAPRLSSPPGFPPAHDCIRPLSCFRFPCAVGRNRCVSVLVSPSSVLTPRHLCAVSFWFHRLLVIFEVAFGSFPNLPFFPNGMFSLKFLFF